VIGICYSQGNAHFGVGVWSKIRKWRKGKDRVHEGDSYKRGGITPKLEYWISLRFAERTPE